MNLMLHLGTFLLALLFYYRRHLSISLDFESYLSLVWSLWNQQETVLTKSHFVDSTPGFGCLVLLA